jgi:short-subunit dehydrogenase
MDLRDEYPNIHVSLVMPGVVSTDFARNVLGEARPPMLTAGQAQTAEEVAEIIARVIREPVAEVYSNPASPEMVRRFYADPGAFAGPGGPPRQPAPATRGSGASLEPPSPPPST